MTTRFITAAAGLLLFAASAWCQTPFPDTGTLDEEFQIPLNAASRKQVPELIARLGSPLFREREEATKGLIEIGPGALTRLRSAYLQSDALEVRLRIERIVNSAYTDYHVFDRFGFLGVQVSPIELSRNKTAQVPDGVVCVSVAKVVEDSGAERGGLEVNDVITAIDGEPLRGGGMQLIDNFAAAIRVHRPGTAIVLSVIRGSSELILEPVVGRVSRERLRNSNINGIPGLLREAEARFPDWWERYFRRNEVPDRRKPRP